MGAKDKVQATNHRYTPTTEQVREDFATRMASWRDDDRRREFDRWLDWVRAEAKAEALRDAAGEVLDTEMPAYLAREVELSATIIYVPEASDD